MDVELGAVDEVAFFHRQDLKPQVHQKDLFGVVLQLYFLLQPLLNVIDFHQLSHFNILPPGVQLHVPQLEGLRSLAFLYIENIEIVLHSPRDLEQFFVRGLLDFLAYFASQLLFFNHVHFNYVPVEHCENRVADEANVLAFVAGLY